MDYARAARKAQEADQETHENKGVKGQCAFTSHYGQCGLRGSIGNAGPKGNRWYCAFHYRVLCRVCDGAVLIQNSIDGLRRAIWIEREQGTTRWDHRTLEEWWEQVEGTILPQGCTNVPGEHGPNSGDVDDLMKTYQNSTDWINQKADPR